MADRPIRPVPITGTPMGMRPRSTANAEINAQKRDEWRYEQGVFDRPEVQDMTPRGYAKGGKVSKDWRKSKVISCREC